jgi:ATP/maltotriose-dependent transcriptional regulator MalT
VSAWLLLPPLRTSIVPRDALLSLLDKGPEGKLTLLTAPAGFGKTTLASLWVTRITGGGRVAWVALDENDDDPARFWHTSSPPAKSLTRRLASLLSGNCSYRRKSTLKPS